MILGFELTLFLYITLAALFWLLRWGSERIALAVLLVANCLLLTIANTLMFVYLAAQVLLVAIIYVAVRYRPSLANSLPWLAFAGLVPMNLNIWLGGGTAVSSYFGYIGHLRVEGVFWTVGASFFVVKSFVALKEAIAGKDFQALPALVGLTFLPAFSAGPIHGSAVWRPGRLSRSLSGRMLAEIVLKIGWGAAALYVIAPRLRRLSAGLDDEVWGVIPQIYLNFAALFFDFSGYTLLAIACGAMFGATLPNNFNRPYLATSIREFWQRWHMSLSWFVSTYLFKPFVRWTGSPAKGIFLAFVCVGIWHEATPGFLLWGIGHGAALSLAMKPPAAWQRLKEALPPPVVVALCWFLTMTWVALLSYTATDLFSMTGGANGS